jgi:hypothetical protein
MRTLAALLVGLAMAAPLAAQRDTAAVSPPGVRVPVGAADTLADSLKKPPVSPRRAMLMSLVLPGYAQAKLKRPTASVMFAAVEVLAIGMARKAALDLREAKGARGDSVPTGFGVDPQTGAVTPSGYVQDRLISRIGARHTHYEDWLAAIIFNHIISAADAYVAANLWDFKPNVTLGPGNRTAYVGGSVRF